MQLALGLIETKGLIGAIEAADAMAKAANVKILNKEKSTAALITIKIEGEVAAVKSAVDAGAAAAQRVGQLVSAHIIPRPHQDLDSIIYYTDKTTKVSKKVSDSASKKEKKAEKLPFPVVEQKESIVKSDDVVLRKDEIENEELFSDHSSGEETGGIANEKPVVVEEKHSEEELVQPKNDIDEDVLEAEENKEEEPSEEVDVKSHLDRLREEAKSEISPDDDKTAAESETKESEPIPPHEELEKLNVHALRKLARSINSFPIKGREISKANRGTLLDLFSNL